MASTEQANDVALTTLPQNRTQSPSVPADDLEGRDDVEDGDLEPIDRGRAAWRMLMSAFIFESLLWGKSPSHSTNPRENGR